MFQNDLVPLEGPWDVALTNGLLAVCAEVAPDAVLKKKGLTKPASELLATAAELGIEVDSKTLSEGLEINPSGTVGPMMSGWRCARHRRHSSHSFGGLTFLRLGYDNSGGDSVPGLLRCLRHERDEDDAWDMYMDQELARWDAASG